MIDAMLFVFGYRAKKIRSKKVSVLIHNSEHHLNLDSCSVSVHFQHIVDLVSPVMYVVESERTPSAVPATKEHVQNNP